MTITTNGWQNAGHGDGVIRIVGEVNPAGAWDETTGRRAYSETWDRQASQSDGASVRLYDGDRHACANRSPSREISNALT